MTDERERLPQEPADNDAVPASDLPEADADAEAEPKQTGEADTDAEAKAQPLAEGERAAGQHEVKAAGDEESVEPRGEEGSAEPVEGAPELRAQEAGGTEETAPEETAQPAPAAPAEEPPTGDVVSASEDTSRPPDDEEIREATAPRPSGVSAETSSTRAAADEVPESDAAAAETPSQPLAESVPEPAAESAAETQAVAAEQPAAEQPAAEAATDQPAAAAQAAEPSAAPAPTAPEPEAPEDPALAELRRAKEEGTTVEGKVIGWNRGGFHVVVGEVTAFCPSSEMELGRPRNPQSYVDRTLAFRVVKFQKKGRRVVLSRAAVLGEERQQVVGKLAPGAVVRGKVTSLPDFGAFVDLGGVEGLVHVSEISRGRVKSPKEALQVGQEVEVKVLKVEQEGERISLSMKDLEPDPWQSVAQRYPRGEKLSGKVARRADFGLFVELEPEVEGLVHVSQLLPGSELGDPSLDPGKEIEVWVREVDRKRQRISLSLREIPSEDPWKEAGKRFPEGEMVEGTVESIAPFGVFVNLAPGLTGLLPGSQTGLPKGTSAARAFSPGQRVRVQVLSIDTRRKRISLGREGSRVEATRGDFQEFKKQQHDREQDAPTAMAAAFARLREERDKS